MDDQDRQNTCMLSITYCIFLSIGNFTLQRKSKYTPQKYYLTFVVANITIPRNYSDVSDILRSFNSSATICVATNTRRQFISESSFLTIH